MLIDNRKLDDDKTEFLIFGTAQQLEKVDIPFCQRGQLRHFSCACWKESLFVVLPQAVHGIFQLLIAIFLIVQHMTRQKISLLKVSCDILIHAFVASRFDYCKAYYTACWTAH